MTNANAPQREQPEDQRELLKLARACVAGVLGEQEREQAMGAILYDATGRQRLERKHWLQPHAPEEFKTMDEGVPEISAIEMQKLRRDLFGSQPRFVIHDLTLSAGDIALSAADRKPRFVRDLRRSVTSQNVVVDALLGRRGAVFIPIGVGGDITAINSDTSAISRDTICIICVYALNPWDIAGDRRDMDIEDQVAAAWHEKITGWKSGPDHDRLKALFKALATPAPDSGEGIAPFTTFKAAVGEVSGSATERFSGELPRLIRNSGVAAATLRRVVPGKKQDEEVWKMVNGWVDVRELAAHVWRQRQDAALIRSRAVGENDEYERLLGSAVAQGDGLVFPLSETSSRAASLLPSPDTLKETLLPIRCADPRSGLSGFVVAFGVEKSSGGVGGFPQHVLDVAGVLSADLSAFLSRVIGINEKDQASPHLADDLARAVIAAVATHKTGRTDDTKNFLALIWKTAHDLRRRNCTPFSRGSTPPGATAALASLAADLDLLFAALHPAYTAGWRVGRNYVLRSDDGENTPDKKDLDAVDLLLRADRGIMRLRNLVVAAQPEDAAPAKKEFQRDPATREIRAAAVPAGQGLGYLELPRPFERGRDSDAAPGESSVLDLTISYGPVFAELHVWEEIASKETTGVGAKPLDRTLLFERVAHGAAPLVLSVIRNDVVEPMFERRIGGRKQSASAPDHHARAGLFSTLWDFEIGELAFRHEHVFRNGGVLTSIWADKWNDKPLPQLANWAARPLDQRAEAETANKVAEVVYDWLKEHVIPDLPGGWPADEKHAKTVAEIPNMPYAKGAPMLTIAAQHFSPDGFRERETAVYPEHLVANSLSVGGLKAFTTSALKVFIKLIPEGQRVPERYVATFFGCGLPFSTPSWRSSHDLLYPPNREKIRDETRKVMARSGTTNSRPGNRQKMIEKLIGHPGGELTWRMDTAVRLREVLDGLLGRQVVAAPGRASQAGGGPPRSGVQPKLATEKAIRRNPMRSTAKKLSELNSGSDSASLQTSADSHFETVLGVRSRYPRVLETLRRAEKGAATNRLVLLLGESGVGKTRIAHAMHDLWKTTHNPKGQSDFVPVNVSSLSETLFESELNGYVKGAFTGAKTSRPGFLARAHRGTLFLDEIGDLQWTLQVKLLTILEEDSGNAGDTDLPPPVRFYPVGSSVPSFANIRFIMATNQPLRDAVERGEFREDLFHRLNVMTIEIPPLRGRPADIKDLLNARITELDAELKQKKSIATETLDQLLHWPWHGNIRELYSRLDRAYIFCPTSELTLEFFGDDEESGRWLELRRPPRSGVAQDEDLNALRACLSYLPESEKNEAGTGGAVAWDYVLTGEYKKRMKLWSQYFLMDDRFQNEAFMEALASNVLSPARGSSATGASDSNDKS